VRRDLRQQVAHEAVEALGGALVDKVEADDESEHGTSW
jgi:hypothetical protein